MPEIKIRPARTEEIQQIVELDHNYSSDFVWQMEFKQLESAVNILFREVRLPRSAHVIYPKKQQGLKDICCASDGLLVAELDNEIVGYVNLNKNTTLKATRATDMAVLHRRRRQGIGSALVIAAQEWALQNKCKRIILEMQPKNYPAIQLAKKLGFELCGYNDHYFANHDIALFFSKWLG